MATIKGDHAANTLIGSIGDDVIYGYDPNGSQATATSLNLTLISAKSGATRPLDLTAAPTDNDHLFVVTQPGLINVVDVNTGKTLAPLLDLTGQIAYREDLGLHSLVFDPDFQHNGQFYIYVAKDLPDGTTANQIWRYTVKPDDPLAANTSSATLIASFDQPGNEHRVGWLSFGPDGYLYLSRGDGDNPNDALHTAQDPFNLLGKILRLDVHNGDAFPNDPNKNYAIPADNPFADGQHGAPEVWALGLRNAFRNSFDPVTGDLWVADVGQVSWEEINHIKPGTPYPINFGWGYRGYEGNDPVPVVPPETNISRDGLTFPAYAYFHDDPNGQYAAIGGFVYHGPNQALQGKYVFTDFGQGWIRTLTDNGDGTATASNNWSLTYSYPNGGNGAVLNRGDTFGITPDGNLWIQDIDGNLFRVDPVAPGPADAGNTINAQNGNDFVYAGDGNDTVSGGAGNDEISAMAGNDVVTGDAGNDKLIGAAGADRLDGGVGDDTVLGGDGDDNLTGGAGDDAVDGGLGTDTVNLSGNFADYLITALADGSFRFHDGRAGSPDGDDIIRGVEVYHFLDGDKGTADLPTFVGGGTPSDGDDVLFGGPFSDTIHAKGGNDSVSGLEGKDFLFGDDGNDTVSGGAGNDKLTGGAGADTLFGGPGKDKFVYAALTDSLPNAQDQIQDFSSDQGDKIHLKKVLGKVAGAFIGTDSFGDHAGEVRYEAAAGGGVTVQLDKDGNGTVDLAIHVLGVSSMSAADFVL